MIFIVRSKTIIALFSGIILCLLLAHIAGQLSVYYFGFNSDARLVRLFDLDSEGNIPTLFSSIILLAASFLFAAIACAKKTSADTYFFHWTGLAVVFLYLCADEALAFHEILIRPLRPLLGASGAFHFTWVIPYGIGLVILSLLYLKFLMHLPGKTRRSLIIAAVIYVSGALSLEMLSGPFVKWYGTRRNITVAVLSTFEELFEMIGVVVLIAALLAYIENSGSGEARIKFVS